MNQTIRIDISSKTQSYCPIAACAEVLADRWSVLILRDIAICNKRTFRSILANSNERISNGVLAGRLKRLTDIGLLSFMGDPVHSQRKIYCLSPAAINLVPIILDMYSWAVSNVSPVKEPIAPPSKLKRPQSEYSKELTDRLRSLHLDPGDMPI